MNKGTKITLGILTSLVAVGGGVVAYRYLVPPRFSVESIDNLKKEGTFKFGRTERSFGGANSPAGASGVMGRGNWGLKYAYDSKGATFTLTKNGKDVRELERIMY